MISEQAPKHGVGTLTLIVHLPHYVRLEEDYSGQYALLSLICHLYNLPIDLDQIKHIGEEQYRRISLAVPGLIILLQTVTAHCKVIVDCPLDICQQWSKLLLVRSHQGKQSD